jgi:hypothetical protein
MKRREFIALPRGCRPAPSRHRARRKSTASGGAPQTENSPLGAALIGDLLSVATRPARI